MSNVVLDNAQYLMRVKKTQLEMLRDRGYSVYNELTGVDESPVLNYTDPMAFTEFYTTNNASLKANMTAIYSNATQNEKIYVYYPETSSETQQLAKAEATAALDFITQYSVSNLIIISYKSPAAGVSKALDQSSAMFYYQLFTYRQLTYNPTKHYLVPKHQILTQDEKNQLLKSKGIELSQLPVISDSDPICRYYGGKPGHIFRIQRYNFQYVTMNKHEVTYRLVKHVPLRRGK